MKKTDGVTGLYIQWGTNDYETMPVTNYDGIRLFTNCLGEVKIYKDLQKEKGKITKEQFLKLMGQVYDRAELE